MNNEENDAILSIKSDGKNTKIKINTPPESSVKINSTQTYMKNIQQETTGGDIMHNSKDLTQIGGSQTAKSKGKITNRVENGTFMKKAILIHGWEGYPEEGWRPWLRSELEKQGFEVIVPAMPNSAKPKMNEWLDHLEKLVGSPDENCYFVGHSLGCITILRYIESFKGDQKIGGAVLVAGFTSNLGYDELDTFFQGKLDWAKIKSHCDKFVAIHSSNDPYVSLHYADFFRNNLGAEVIVEQDKKHFSGDDGINELPAALKSILKLQG